MTVCGKTFRWHPLFGAASLSLPACPQEHAASSPAMFGCVVAGRIVHTNLQQVDETHAYFELPNASTINHLCVFLLGTSESCPPANVTR